MKSVQIRGFCWSLFSRIRTEYGDIQCFMNFMRFKPTKLNKAFSLFNKEFVKKSATKVYYRLMALNKFRKNLFSKQRQKKTLSMNGRQKEESLWDVCSSAYSSSLSVIIIRKYFLYYIELLTFQRRIQNPNKNLRWSFVRKYSTAFSW